MATRKDPSAKKKMENVGTPRPKLENEQEKLTNGPKKIEEQGKSPKGRKAGERKSREKAKFVSKNLFQEETTTEGCWQLISSRGHPITTSKKIPSTHLVKSRFS